jgi:hypothetical protein
MRAKRRHTQITILVEDGGIEPWLKPKTIQCVFAVQNNVISTRTFQTCFILIYGSVIAFLYVCMSVRVFINLITIAVISIDLFYLKVNYFVNIFQNNDFFSNQEYNPVNNNNNILTLSIITSRPTKKEKKKVQRFQMRT